MVRFWTLAAALAAGALAACTQSKSTPTTPTVPTASVALTPASTLVIADGTHTVRIDFVNALGGTATLSTSQGTFESSGLSTVATAAASGYETLRTCTLNAPGCTSPTTTVSITAGSSTVSKSISFVSRAVACQASCAADSTCDSATCTLSGGAAGVCASGACTAGSACTPSPASATTETSCSDGIDNDCNGKRDCAESSCAGQPCKAGSPTFACRNGACTDISTGLSVTVTPSRARLPAIANVDAEVVVSVASQADPAANVTVAVSLSDASLGTLTPATAMTDARGVARFTFRTTGATGSETITASLAAIPAVSGTTTITVPRLASVRLVTGTPGSVQYAVMGAKGSGWQDLSWLKVLAVDDLGLPYPDGLPVRFEHHQLGAGSATSRSTLGLPLTADTATCVAASGCVGYQAVTASTGGAPDSAGVATAWIYSGAVAGTLSVTASASAGGASFGTLLPTIAVVGAKASGSNLSVVCSPRNVPALAETDCAISLVDAPFTCEAILKDRFGNVLGRSTQVVFASEAGSVGQIVSTPAYDPAGAAQTGLGLAIQKFETLGNGLPFDVEPLALLGEPGVSHQLDGCGVRTHNPRDGVVTIIAVADGEEAFFDANGNGSYDVGEPFVDLGEPFIDQDDSGTWTAGEWFLDLDGNGTWTGPNTVWDAHTKIWTQTYVVYTGPSAHWVPSGGRFMGTRIADALVDACVSTAAPAAFDVFYETSVHAATSQGYAAVASDGNFNFLTSKTTYAVAVAPSTADLKPTYFGLPSYADLTGMEWRYWPCANAGAGPCASQCRGPGACRMKPEFTGFTCGVAMTPMIAVTGGSKAAAGALRLLVDVPWNRYGGNLVDHDWVEVSGGSHP